jgi:hypothetical protein
LEQVEFYTPRVSSISPHQPPGEVVTWLPTSIRGRTPRHPWAHREQLPGVASRPTVKGGRTDERSHQEPSLDIADCTWDVGDEVAPR